MWIAARRRIVVRWLITVLWLLKLNSLLVLVGIVTVVLVKLLPSALGIDGPRGLRAILRRRWIVGRRRARGHPASSPQRRESLATATTGVTCKEEEERDDEKHEETGEHPSPPPIPARVIGIASSAAEIVAIWTVKLALVDREGQLLKGSHRMRRGIRWFRKYIVSDDSDDFLEMLYAMKKRLTIALDQCFLKY